MSTLPVNSDSSQASVTNQLNNVAREVQGLQEVQVFKDDSGTRRVILDKNGLRTSPEGIDVYDATDAELTFNSNNNVFKIVQTGTLSIAGVSVSSGNFNTRTSTVTHNLGFVPAVIAFSSPNGGAYISWSGLRTDSFSVGAGTGVVLYGLELYDLQINTSDVTFRAQYLNGAGTSRTSPTHDIKYYILQETAN